MKEEYVAKKVKPLERNWIPFNGITNQKFKRKNYVKAKLDEMKQNIIERKIIYDKK